MIQNRLSFFYYLFALILTGCDSTSIRKDGVNTNVSENAALLLIKDYYNGSFLADDTICYRSPIDSLDHYLFQDTMISLSDNRRLIFFHDSYDKKPCPHVGSGILIGLFEERNNSLRLISFKSDAVSFAPWCDLPKFEIVKKDLRSFLVIKPEDGNGGFFQRYFQIINIDSSEFGRCISNLKVMYMANHCTHVSKNSDIEKCLFYESDPTLSFVKGQSWDIELKNSFIVTNDNSEARVEEDRIIHRGTDLLRLKFTADTLVVIDSVIQSPDWARIYND